MTIITAADITGDDARHAISSTAGAQARTLWLTATGGPARFGDVNVSSGQGVELAAGVEYEFSASAADPTDTIDLNAAQAYVPSGTTLTRSWGV